MNTRHLSACMLACAALLASSAATAQLRRITPVPQPVRQAPPPGVATFALPNPAGLRPPDVPNLSSPGVAPGSPPIDAGIATPTSPGGGGGMVVVQQSGGGGTNAMGFGGSSTGMYSAVDIARAFITADVNHDGLLSRGEAQRLAIVMPRGFDDVDRNHDGMLTRFEYEDAFQ